MVYLENKKYLIYGFGLSGRSTFNFLKNKNYVKIFDDKKKNIPKKLFNNAICKKDLKKIKFDYIVLSPGINISKCLLKNYLKKNINLIISDLDIFYFLCPKNKKIAITGTNGKSTTSYLIYNMLRNSGIDTRLVGNIGTPILSEKKITNKTVFIVEISSYQIEYSKYFSSDIALILNISPDHLDRHETFAKYRKIKLSIVKNQKKNALALINSNINISSNFFKNTKSKLKQIYLKNIMHKKTFSKIYNECFKDKNNMENLNFAYEISKIFNIKIKNFIKTANSFKGLNFRQQIILKKKNIVIINDSKSTSFSSSINLIKSYKNIYWILGGLKKRGDKLNLKKNDIKNVKAYIFGKDRNDFEQKIKKIIKCKKFSNLYNATKQVSSDIKYDNTLKYIIFSPSAASFDQFRNFEDRGFKFNSIIKKLYKKKNAK